jgi:hypothetical protein
MNPRQSDADVERVVASSAAFRWCRAALETVDAAIASSAAVHRVRSGSLPSAGAVLIVAAVVHGALVTLEPAAVAPLGRYLFAVCGLLAGAGLLASARQTR